MSILRTSNGWLLANGKPLQATIGASAVTTTLTLTPYYVGNTLARPVWQRNAGTEGNADGGYGDVPILYTFAGGAPVVEARVTDKFRNVVVKDWTTVINPQIDANGQVVGTLPAVPIGMDYNTDIRVKGNVGVASSSTQKWGVGPNILLLGQSNMVHTLASDVWNEAVPGSTLGENAYWNDPSFTGTFFSEGGFVVPYTVSGSSGDNGNQSSANTDQGGSIAFLRLVGAALTAKYGRKIPVCATLWAWNGTSLDRMTPAGAADRAQIYTNTGTSTGAIGWKSPKGYGPGDFEMILLHQGEAESGSGSTVGLSRTDRLTELKTFYSEMLKIVAPAGRTAANLSFLPAVLGIYTQCAGIENIRGANYDLVSAAPGMAWPNVSNGWNCIDLDTTDGYSDPNDSNKGIHFVNVSGGNQYAKWSHRRMVQAALKKLGCSTVGAMGPKITGVTRAGNVATLTVTHDGGSSLSSRSAAALTGWYANTATDFSGTDIAVTATIASANTISVTFPGGTAFPCYLKYMGNKVGTLLSQNPGGGNPVYDNVTYPTGANPGDQFTGLPLQPTPDAIQVN